MESDGLKDGAFNMHLADVAAGAHIVALTLDESPTSAGYDFTKVADGSIVHAAAAGHTMLLSASHDQRASAAQGLPAAVRRGFSSGPSDLWHVLPCCLAALPDAGSPCLRLHAARPRTQRGRYSRVFRSVP